jgi:ankyrin repeat protein
MSELGPILNALYRGDIVAAEHAATGRTDLDLFEAAALGRAPRVRALVDGARERARAYSSDGFTALHLAAFFGHAEVARLLVAAGADVDAISRNPMQVRPLHSAAARGDHAVMRLLLDAGAEVDARQAGGFTALQSRALHGDVTMVRELLARGASAEQVADDGQTAADMARAKGYGDVLALLSGSATPNAR